MMNNNEMDLNINIGSKDISFSTGKLAKQANGAVMVKCGGNGVLVTATMSEDVREGMDFFPLIIDVEERMYAAGKIPGGFFKREGRASDKAILVARLTDRPLRPIFDKNMRNEVQVVATVLSVDQTNPYDILVINGASAALYISDIPFEEPVGAVRIGKLGDDWIVNPTSDEIKEGLIDIVVAGTEDAILMVEAKCKEASEEIVTEALERAHVEIKRIIEAQKEFKSRFEIKKQEVQKYEIKEDILSKVRELTAPKIQEKLDQVIEYSKSDDRETLLDSTKKGFLADSLKQIRQEVTDSLLEEYPEDKTNIDDSLKVVEREIVRKVILEEKVRPDGRGPRDIRKISCEVGLFPDTTHGTGLFTRGKTQALTILALGSIKESQRIDSLQAEEFKRYMHHYNFPPFSVGETAPIRGPKRREVGHGALAEKALKPMIPDEDSFPYSIRLVSEILESNGSTSMASVCGSTLALMDAGVPIKRPVSGIAMGLVKGEDDFVVLSDIQGIEDFYGDMDFKVAGTVEGITALQMDMKVKGIEASILGKALEQAKEGRMFILDKMLEVIPEPRVSLSKAAPKITIFKIPREKIGDVIGPGGKNIKKTIEEFDLEEIDINDDEGEGIVYITGTNEENNELAKKKIIAMIKGIDDIDVGDEFVGTVVGITNYGAFVNLVPGLDGLLHISKVADRRIEKVEDVLKIGDKIGVKAVKIDRREKKIGLERTDL